jgi:hypothetical protein
LIETTRRSGLRAKPCPAFPAVYRLLEQVFDLPIDAAQLLLCPGLQIRPEARVDAQQE